MNLAVPVKDSPAPQPLPQPVRRGPFPWIIVTLIVAMLGGGGWYYFFGRKPKVAMTVGLELNGDVAARGLWTVGPGELLLVGDGDAHLIDTVSRKKKWTVQIPKTAAPEPARQATLNARFVRLHEWADDLSRRRGSLTGAEEIQAFNDEAAKYHEQLTATRVAAANPNSGIAPAAATVPAAEPEAVRVADAEDVFGGDRAKVDRLRPIEDMRVQLLIERMKKREGKLDALKSAMILKKGRAITAVQKVAANDAEACYKAELAEQKKDEGALAKLMPADPKPVVAAGNVEVEDGPPSSDDEFTSALPKAAICRDRIWIVEGRHAVAFDRSSGAVKAEVGLAGPARQVFADGDTAIIVASAGASAVQITRLTANALPVAAYYSTGRREAAYTFSGHSRTPNVQNSRTEFSAVGGSLLRVDIRLKEKNVTVRDAIKPGSEKELAAAAGGAAAHSVDEMKSIAALIRNDAARFNGANVEHVDDSTYEITLRRPFDPAVPEWTGTLRGRVQVFSTPTLHLITAGTKLLAFDRANKKMWEAVLGSPVQAGRSDSGSAAPPPWLETPGRLFFADGAFLTAFDSASGQVAWRLPSVGIRKMVMDGEGFLYVLSGNARVESLSFAMDASFGDSVPITMRVNSADGKIAWQVEKYQDVWASGKDVYVLRESQNPHDVEEQVFNRDKQVAARVKLYKLSRKNGSPLWEWFQPRRPQAVEAHGKSVAMLFGEELQIIKSICW